MEIALPAHLNLSLKRPILRPPTHCKYYYIDLASRDWYRTAQTKCLLNRQALCKEF